MATILLEIDEDKLEDPVLSSLFVVLQLAYDGHRKRWVRDDAERKRLIHDDGEGIGIIDLSPEESAEHDSLLMVAKLYAALHNLGVDSGVIRRYETTGNNVMGDVYETFEPDSSGEPDAKVDDSK